jgi:hypothetical protein
MKPGRQREGVVGKINHETPRIHDITEKRMQMQNIGVSDVLRETFT